MSADAIRDLQKIGRQLNGVDPNEIGVRNLSPRTCFIVACPRDKLDTSAYLDALKAARMFIRADFKMYFLSMPEYSDFYRWFSFLLTNTYEYLSVVFTGFPMVTPSGETNIASPLLIEGRELTPTKIFKQIKKYKHPASRLTVVINGCPAVETWSNAGPQTEKLAFSKTSISFNKPVVKPFANEVPEQVLLVTAALRLDIHVDDRARNGSGYFINELSQIVKDDPVLNATEVLNQLTPRLRTHGEEAVVFASSYDVEAEKPFLL
ncbi:hypothetical protein TRFO_30307 [Tritrichomonas foetus]|uniref:Uncharacterized protein n=1 Tax=Tritrichomonas foetus TaxID=1144522 RepID=A0A1J4JUY6_9EUKA|nr:hypothetical protein TRFO_30307 [Tritrichomonas foetus]|eukprot:OHT02522.1 hypothetical protein TRFO_30307 [Tritrichomonas foetus]